MTLAFLPKSSIFFLNPNGHSIRLKNFLEPLNYCGAEGLSHFICVAMSFIAELWALIE